jgi:PAS domain S-box-containing protein
MPGTTGFELARMIRARNKSANVPIIFLTAHYGDDRDVIQGYEAGAVDYVRKPVDMAILRSKVGIFADLYRKQRNLEEINRVLVAVVESCDDAIISEDLDGIIATVNQGAERLFGYKAEEMVGKPVTILIPPDRQPDEPEILARIRRGERVDHSETVRRRKDGTLVDVSLTVSPVKDDQGRIVGASKIARDITERKLTETKLRDSEQQLRVRSSLRLRPDRIPIGEVRGAEALDLLKAWGTGHPGGIGTIHAGSAIGALRRLEQLIQEAVVTVPRALIAETINLIAVLAGRGAERKLVELAVVKGFQPGGDYVLEPAIKRTSKGGRS